MMPSLRSRKAAGGGHRACVVSRRRSRQARCLPHGASCAVNLHVPCHGREKTDEPPAAARYTDLSQPTPPLSSCHGVAARMCHRHCKWIALACVLALSSAAGAQVPPEKALSTFTVAEGLELSLWASEPLFANPTSI